MFARRRTRSIPRPATAAVAAVFCATATGLTINTPLAAADSAVASSTPAKVEIVMDASGSMAEKADDGKSKIDAARSALTTVVDGLPADAQTGLRVYGATVPDTTDTPAACADTQLVVPIGTDNQAALKTAIGRYQPKGQTPTAYALEQAAKDLGTTGPRSIILVSDGEATCRKDPCDTAKTLAAQGIDLRIDVIGLKVGSAARKQLQCVAESGNGTYYDAADSDQLTKALKSAQFAAQAPFRPEGTKVTGTSSRQPAPTLTAGHYVDDMPQTKDADRWYRLHHTIPGSTLWVGVTTQMAKATFSTLYAYLEGAENLRCDSGGEVHRTLPSVVLSSYAPSVKGCESSADQFLRVSGAPDKPSPGQQTQIIVYEEPPATGPRTSPDVRVSDHTVWQAMPTAGTPSPIPAVSSVTDAPKLAPGTYSFDLAPGSTALMKVHLDWGQRLQAISSVPRKPEGVSFLDTGIETRVLSPIGGAVAAYFPRNAPVPRNLATETQGSLVALTTPTVDYAGRNSRYGPEHVTARPGDYYIAVSRKVPSADAPQITLPVVIQVAVPGKAGEGAPTYQGSAAPSSDESAAPSASSSTSVRASDVVVGEPAGGSGGKNWALIGGAGAGAVALAAVGSAAAIALRRKQI